VLLLTILIVEIAIGIVVFVRINEEGWEQTLRNTVTQKFDAYANTSDPVLAEAVNDLQRNVSQCCMLKKFGPIFFSTYKGYPVQLLA